MNGWRMKVLYFGSPGRIRTNDPAVNSRLLCQLSYRGTISGLFSVSIVRVSCQALVKLGMMSKLRKGVRAVEGARLERVYTGNCIVGSNPTLSARN